MAAMSASRGRKAFETIGAGKMIGVTIALFYPATIVASCWWSLHGSGDNSKKFTFHPKHHRKLDPSEYAALPAPTQEHRDNIVKETLNIYQCKPSFDAERIYAPEATFEDPTVYLDGHTSIACLIWGLPKIANKAEVNNVNVEQYDQAVSLKFDYRFETSILTISAPVQVYLTLDENQERVVKHEDMWNGRDLFEFEGAAHLGRYINGLAARVVFGISTGRLFR